MHCRKEEEKYLPVRDWRPEYPVFLTFLKIMVFLFISKYEIVMDQQRRQASEPLRRLLGRRGKSLMMNPKYKGDLIFLTYNILKSQFKLGKLQKGWWHFWKGSYCLSNKTLRIYYFIRVLPIPNYWHAVLSNYGKAKFLSVHILAEIAI